MHAPCWALLDSRAGHRAHTLGLLEALALNYEAVHLQSQRLALSPMSLLPPAYRHQPRPKLVVATGKRPTQLAYALKRRQPDMFVIQCLGKPSMLADILLLPAHNDEVIHPQLFRFLGALNPVTPESLTLGANAFSHWFASMPRPYTALLMGGATKGNHFAPQEMRSLLDKAEFLASGGTLFILPSRRTPAAFLTLARQRLTGIYKLYDPAVDQENPYMTALALCDRFIVSGDSISMMSEAASTGKPLLIAPNRAMSAKHHRCAKALIAAGHADWLRADTDWPQPAARLQETARIAELVRPLLPAF